MSVFVNIFGAIDRDEDNNVFLFGSHQYALYYWVKCFEKGSIKHGANLVHIDFHSDFLSSEGVFDNLLSSKIICEQIINKSINYDNFIRVAKSMKLIDHIDFCCKPQVGEFNDVTPYINYVSPIKLLEQRKFFIQESNCSKNNLILDIDLDFFVSFEDEYIKLKEEKQIINEIKAINKLSKLACLTTIATSQDWSWEKEHREKVQQLFFEHSIFRLDFFRKPEPIEIIL